MGMEGFNLFNEIPVRKQNLNNNETKIKLVFKRNLEDFVMPHQNYNTSTKKVENSLNRVVNNSNKLEDNTIDKKVESNISIDNIMQNVTKRDKILQKRSQENKNKRVKVNFIELNKEFKINILEEQKPRVLTKK